MRTPMRASRIVWYEGAAFAAIILIAWINELCGIENLLFGQPDGPPDWHDPMIVTLFTIMVGVPTLLLSNQLAKRLHYLEGFLRVCAWCHRVGDGENWMSLEEYVKKTFNTETTHGICSNCSRKLKNS